MILLLKKLIGKQIIIHILFEASPSNNLVKFINSYKSASSRMVKKEFPIIKRSLWKSAFWKTGYFITTTGGANIETIRRLYRKTKRKIIKKINNMLGEYLSNGLSLFLYIKYLLVY